MRASLALLLAVVAAPFAVVALNSGCSFVGTGQGSAAPPANGTDGGGTLSSTTIDPTQPQNVVSPDGVGLKLPANALVDAKGAAPQGPVSVGLGSTVKSGGSPKDMPGGFTATDATNAPVAMESGGAVRVEVKDQSGNALELKSGMFATLTIPAIQGGPSQLSLFSLDEASASPTWHEEGKASLQQGGYTGDIPHLSQWAAGVACASGCITGHVVDGAGNSVPAAQVEARVTSASACAAFWSGGIAGGAVTTDDRGTFLISGIIAPSQVVLGINGAPTSSVVSVNQGGACTNVGDVSAGGNAVFPDASAGSSSGGGSGSGSGSGGTGPGPGCNSVDGPVNVSGTWTGSFDNGATKQTLTLTCNQTSASNVDGQLDYSPGTGGDGCAAQGTLTVQFTGLTLSHDASGTCTLQGNAFNPNGIGWNDNVNFVVSGGTIGSTMVGSAAPACSGVGWTTTQPLVKTK